MNHKDATNILLNLWVSRDAIKFGKDKFQAKQVSVVNGVPYIKIYESEFKWKDIGRNIYFEFCDIKTDFDENTQRLLMTDRALFTIPANYPFAKLNTYAPQYYFFPVSDLIKVDDYTVGKKFNSQDVKEELKEDSKHIIISEKLDQLGIDSEFEESFEKRSEKSLKMDQDMHLNTMTIRDFFAILHLSPVSNKPFVNDMINETVHKIKNVNRN